jgi:hypothetical protein
MFKTMTPGGVNATNIFGAKAEQLLRTKLLILLMATAFAKNV